MKCLLTSDIHYGYDSKSHSKQRKFWTRVSKEVVAQDIKVIVIAGDIAVNRQRHIECTFRLAREFVPNVTIACVLGNHDWWDTNDPKDKDAGRRSFARLSELHEELFKRYDIHYLQNKPLVVTDNDKSFMFCGWDGWYANVHPMTNDDENIFMDVEGAPMHHFMSSRAWKTFDALLTQLEDPEVQKKYDAIVAVTHHNPYCDSEPYRHMIANERFLEEIKPRVDVFCCGHSHQRRDEVVDGCRILNAGSEYNQPQHIVFEVGAV